MVSHDYRISGISLPLRSTPPQSTLGPALPSALSRVISLPQPQNKGAHLEIDAAVDDVAEPMSRW